MSKFKINVLKHLGFGSNLTFELWHLTFLGGKVVSFGIKRSL
jgi:hypothetical protein